MYNSNNYMIEYSTILVFVLFSTLLSVVLPAASYALGIKKTDSEKFSVYECGFDPFGDSRKKFEVRFFLVAILFIICSTTSWVSGILVMRKSWRVFGALDMVLSWIVAMIMFSIGAGIEAMLAILIASSILLGVVTYLNQTYEKEIING